MYKNININKFLYAGFTLLGFYYLLTGRYQDAPIYLGIALAFDPFDPKMPWDKRPSWQKLVLIVHLVVTAGALGYVIGFSAK